MKRVGLAFAVACVVLQARAENPAEVVELGRVDVVGTSPLPGLGVPLAQVPANVQAVRLPSSRDPFGSLPATLDRLSAGTAFATGQGNPFQPDFSFRGFVASPLLGQPQGVSVFQDGVRLNEPFGDVVNWDLIPAAAIGSVQLLPGSSPLFGPNTLGGVIALYSRSGAEFPGGAVEMQSGSFGRRSLLVEQGGRSGPWDWFATADALHESGWAAHNPSLLRRGFVKVGHQTDRSDIDVSLTVANNVLQGSQALPVSFLGDIRQPYTWPDVNRNRVAMLAAKGSRFLAEGILIGGTAYWRRFHNENLSSNVNAESGGGAPAATNDLAAIAQLGAGAGLQLTIARPLAGRGNVFIAGLSLDSGDAEYARSEQAATFNAFREAVGLGGFDQDTRARTRSQRTGAFVSDTFRWSERWALTLSGRRDATDVRISDLSGMAAALEGHHRFSRFNPGVGMTYQAFQNVTTYAAYGESMRAPTAMELTCADPAAPCKLPNAFLSDPPLRAVVARTVEAGARGSFGEHGRWSAAVFRTAVRDDIQFVSGEEAASTAGYFRNVGPTRRQGLELGLDAAWEPATVRLRYSRVDATFRSAFHETSPNNASADASGTIAVVAGDRMPGVPRDSLRLSVEATPVADWFVEGSLSAASRLWARGNENNGDAAGIVPGYAVMNAKVRWRANERVEIALIVDNLFDTRHERSGVLGRNHFAQDANRFDTTTARAEAFRGPGAPFGAWLSLRWRWN